MFWYIVLTLAFSYAALVAVIFYLLHNDKLLRAELDAMREYIAKRDDDFWTDPDDDE